MPSPNAAPKTSTKKTPDKKADLGQKLGRRKSQDFNSKIVDWNGTGAGVAQEQDEVVVIEEDHATKGGGTGAVVVLVDSKDSGGDGAEAEFASGHDTPPAPKTPVSGVKAANRQASQRKTSREVDVGKKAWVRRKSKPQVETSSDLKEAGVPKKRVVSDGHWRRDRAQKETATPETEKEKETTPKPVTVRRSVVSVGLKLPPSIQDFEEEPEPIRVRPLGRRSRSRSRDRDVDRERGGTPDYESSGTKVYIKRRRRSKTVDDAKQRKGLSTSESSLTASSSFDKPSTATDFTTPDASPTKDHPPRPSTAPRDRIPSSSLKDQLPRKIAARASLEAEDVSPRLNRRAKTPFRDEEDRRLPSKGASTDPVKIPADKKPPTPIPKVFGNRIQGWLAQMPDDPFTDQSEPSLAPEPLEIPRRKSKRVEDAENADDSGRRGSGAQTRRSRPSLEPIDTNERSRPLSSMRTSIDDWVDDAPIATTPTLKRNGARRNTHSPVKGRLMRGASTQIDDQSLALSARPRGLSTGSEQQTIIADESVLSRASDGDEPVTNGTGLRRRLTKHSDLMSVLSLPREDEHKITSARSIRTRRVRNETATVGDLMNEVSTDELKYQRELRTLVDGVIPVLLTYVLSKDKPSRTPGSRQSSVQDNPALTQPIYDMGVALERLKASHKRIPMHDPNEFLLWAQSSIKVYEEYIKVWRLGFEDIVVNLAPAEEGQKTEGDGERVDVAYLLKRPLVRVKNLTKTLQGINQIKPSALAEDMADTYQGLVVEARRRANDERARLEDEAAAAIDATRARNPRNLAPLNGVSIDPLRSVRARDYFDMELFHSSGQQLDCKIELIRRDNPPSIGGSGDVLFCEVSESGRWLLFPPVLATYVSARRGDKGGELLVMVRGLLPGGSEWREIMVLQSTDEQATEWMQMLGSNPMPPRLTKQSSFNTLRRPSGPHDVPVSPKESEVPIGERAKPTAPTWDGSDVNSALSEVPPPRLPKQKATRYRSTPSSPLAGREPILEEHLPTDRGRNGLKSGYGSSTEDGQRPRTGHARSNTECMSDNRPSLASTEYKVWIPASDHGSDDSGADEEDISKRRPTMRRRTSSVPSSSMPTIPKLRHSGQPTPSGKGPGTPTENVPSHVVEDPSSAPSKLQKRRPSSKEAAKAPSPDAATPALHSGTASVGLRSGALPSFTPEFLKKHRRSSSPLKHEYEPSTATDSPSDSDLSDVEDGESVTSDSTADDVISTVGELKNFSKFGSRRPARQPSLKSSRSVEIDTLGPSDSPSQAAYRSVPPSSNGSAKSVACIFSWSESGVWDSLHPEECEIVVTPGLIEAFDLAQAHAVSSKSAEAAEASPSAYGVRPLVALELTPLVPLRRGTALDISIRSPPTKDSLLRKGNNMMFRSRSPEECEKLYALINRARIDNPTWIALQNARGPVKTSNWAEVMDRRNASRPDNPSWIKSLSRKGSTYRSKGARSASIAASQSSVGTMSSAISALRRFNGGNIFNIAKSTINSKQSTRSSYSDSLSSGAATPVPIDPSMGTPVGITNAKCRFYARETESKWRDLGAARLTIMLPPRSDPASVADPNTTGLTKRILVCGKSKGEVIFDETLLENSFERIHRTGIAVHVWEELMGPNGERGHAAATGGVASFRTRTYMIQMKSVSCLRISIGLLSMIADVDIGTRGCIHLQHGRQTSILVSYAFVAILGGEVSYVWRWWIYMIRS